MRVSRLLLSLCLLVLVGTISFTKSASALGFPSDQGIGFYGMDDSGDVVFSNNSGICEGGAFGTCYMTYLQNGTFVNKSDTAPTFTPDNGTPCTPSLPTGWTYVFAVCNNGLEAFTGIDPAVTGPQNTNVFYGTTANPTEFAVGSGPSPGVGGALIFINSQGFVVFNNNFADQWQGVQDPAALTLSATPEPSSLILLGTGALGLVGAVRRRILGSR